VALSICCLQHARHGANIRTSESSCVGLSTTETGAVLMKQARFPTSSRRSEACGAVCATERLFTDLRFLVDEPRCMVAGLHAWMGMHVASPVDLSTWTSFHSVLRTRHHTGPPAPNRTVYLRCYIRLSAAHICRQVLQQPQPDRTRPCAVTPLQYPATALLRTRKGRRVFCLVWCYLDLGI